jgi:hypothetical protein
VLTRITHGPHILLDSPASVCMQCGVSLDLHAVLHYILSDVMLFLGGIGAAKPRELKLQCTSFYRLRRSISIFLVRLLVAQSKA